MALFRLEDVKFRSQTQEIIKGISLEIEKGSVNIFSGMAGSGKSTLLKLTAGILVPSGGKVFYKDMDIQTMSNAKNRQFRRECSFVFQDSALWANQNIQQNLDLVLQTQRPELDAKARLERIKEMCEIVHYERALTLRPVDLSMGEQKKIAFARAMINDPETLFLDECTESLDRKTSTVIMNLIRKFIDDGNTVIYVSHNTTFVTEFTGNVFAIAEGLLLD